VIHARIIGTGHYLPEKVVTNHDLEKIMDTTDEWIRQRTGILQRHIAADDEAASDLGVHAANRAIESACIDADDIDYVICATFSPDHAIPSTACLIQDRIGATKAGAVDLNAACSGFIYALEVADAFIRAGVHETILVVASEVLSAHLDWTQRNTAILFGDGAGAVIVRAEEGEHGILSTFTASDGSAGDILAIPAGGSRLVVTPENIDEVDRSFSMNGPELYKRAIKAFGEGTERALAKVGLSAESIDLFVPHQANKRIIDAAVGRIGLPEEKIYMNLDKVANTSAASIPIALDQALIEGRLKDEDLVLLAAFGAGLTWASAMVRW